MPVWTASACSPVQTCRWTRCAEGFNAALPTHQGSGQCTWSTHRALVWGFRHPDEGCGWEGEVGGYFAVCPSSQVYQGFCASQCRKGLMCLMLLPGGPIPASLRPPRLQKTCIVSPQWTTCQRLRGNNPEEGSRTPKGKYFSLNSPCCWSACWHFSMLWDMGRHHYGLLCFGYCQTWHKVRFLFSGLRF